MRKRLGTGSNWRQWSRLYGLVLIVVLLLGACSGPEEKRDQFYSQAQKYFDQGRYKEARLELKNAVKIDSRFAPGYALLGRCFLELGEWPQAYAHLSKAVELDPLLTRVQTDLGLLFFRSNELKRAENKAGLVLEQDPDDEDARLLLAMIQDRRGETDQAESGLEQLIAQNPKLERAYLLLAQVREAAAAEVLSRGLKEVPESRLLRMRLIEVLSAKGLIREADEQFEILLAQNPEQIALRQKHIEFLEQTGRIQEAMREAGQLVDREPQVAAHRLRLAQVHLTQQDPDRAIAVLETGIEKLENPFLLQIALGDIRQRHQELETAELVYRDAVRQAQTADNKAEARLRLARMFLAQGELDRAAQEAELLREDDPGNIQAGLVMGQVFLQNGRPGDAIIELRQVIREHPEIMSAYTHLARAHFDDDEPRNAVQVLSQALDKDPQYVPAREALVRYFLHQGEWERAAGHLQVLTEQHADNQGYRLALAEASQEMGDADTAEKIYREVVEAHPDFLPAVNNLAYLWAEKGMHLNKALELVEKAAANGDAHALDTLGWVHYKMGNKELALKYLRKAQEKAVDDEVIREHLEIVRQ